MQIPIGIRNNATNEILSIPSESHSACFGKSGVGKSVYLGNLLNQLVRAGEGAAFIDPHGSVVDYQLSHIPLTRSTHNRHDVILLRVLASSVPGVNIFTGPGSIDEKVSATVDTFAKTFEAAWGESSDSVLRWACYAVLEGLENPTLIDVKRFLKDDKFMQSVLKKVTNQNVLDEFSGYEKKEWKDIRASRIAPVLNKLDKFITNAHVRAIIGQAKSLDFRKIINEGRIFLVDLSGLGKKEKAMLGTLILNMLFIAAQTRKPGKGRPFSIVVDEAQTFVSAPYDFILAELRKYKVTLHLASQYISGYADYMRDGIFGNVGTMVTFRVGGEDAEILAKEMAMDQQPRILQQLANKYAYIRTLEYDKTFDALVPRGPYEIKMFPPSPPTGEEQDKRKVIADSLKWFAKDKKEVLSTL